MGLYHIIIQPPRVRENAPPTAVWNLLKTPTGLPPRSARRGVQLGMGRAHAEPPSTPMSTSVHEATESQGFQRTRPGPVRFVLMEVTYT